MAKKKKKKASEQNGTVAGARYRDALTGRYVTKKYAKKHRKTTVKVAVPPAL